MKNYINGYKNPAFVITDLNTGLQTTILIGKYIQYTEEEFKEEWLEAENLNRQIVRKFLGYRFSWSLYFADYLENENTFKLNTILSAFTDNTNYRVTFMPSVDEPGRYFDVTTEQDAAYSFKHSQTIEAAAVMEGFILKLRSVSLYPSRNWLDPNRQRFIAENPHVIGYLETV